LIIMALAFFCASYIAHEKNVVSPLVQFPTEPHVPAREKHLKLDTLLDTPASRKYEDYALWSFYAFGALYVVTFLISIFVTRLQLGWSASFDEDNMTHSDYSLFVSGLPDSVTSPEPLIDYLNKLVKTSGTSPPVIGASICYDIRGKDEEIENAIDDWIIELDESFPLKFDNEEKVEDLEDFHKARCWGCDCIDTYFVGTASDDPARVTKKYEVKDLEWLQDVKGSGQAIVVFSSMAACQDCEDLLKVKTTAPFQFEGQSYNLKGKDVDEAEPMGILWTGFFQDVGMELFFNRVKFVFFVTLAVSIFIALFLPYAAYVGYQVMVPGKAPEALEEQLVGFLITFANIIVATLVDVAAEKLQFRTKSNRDCVVICAAFLATLVNTVGDLLMLQWGSHGERMTETFEDQTSTYEQMLGKVLFSAIVMGYLIIPFIAAPIAERAPFWPTKNVINTRRLNRREAEKQLELPPFDMRWRYSDNLNNFTVTLALCFIASPYAWMASLALVGNLIMVGFIDRVLILRQTTKTYYVTGRLSTCFSFLWVVPSGVIAVLVGWWGFRAGQLDKKWMGFFLLIHVTVYMCIMVLLKNWAKNRRMSARADTFDSAYNSRLKVGDPWTYFNTNPIFCLRTRAEGLAKRMGQTPPAWSKSGWQQVKNWHRHDEKLGGCVPFCTGKDYLQPSIDNKQRKVVMDKLRKSVSMIGVLASMVTNK